MLTLATRRKKVNKEVGGSFFVPMTRASEYCTWLGVVKSNLSIVVSTERFVFWFFYCISCLGSFFPVMLNNSRLELFYFVGLS